MKETKCLMCKTGYMKPTGTVYLTLPPQYPHICDNSDCKQTATFREPAFYRLKFNDSIGK